MGKKKTKDRTVVLKRVGLQIRAARRKKGISQEALAFGADLDRSYVGGVERGERNITVVNLKKIAGALKVSLSDLLEGL
jgi:transcriptional regulator with XRE-family HTH domain